MTGLENTLQHFKSLQLKTRMNNLKIISLGNGGTNILNGIRQHLPQEVVTASLCSANGKIDESDIGPLFPDDLSVVVLITCLGGRCSKIVPNVLKTAKGKNIECLCVCIMPFSSEDEETCRSAEKTLEDIRNETDILIVLKNEWLNEKYGNLPINEAMKKMDMTVWKLIGTYITDN